MTARHRLPIASLVSLGVIVATVTTARVAGASDRGGAFAIRGGSARAAVLGEAFVATSGDAEVALYNPAGLVGLRGPRLEATYHDVFGLGLARHGSLVFGWRGRQESIRVAGDSIFAALGDPSGPAAALGISLLDVDLEPESYDELGVSIALAHEIRNGTGVGITARYLRASSSLPGVSATGYALDLGVQQSVATRVRAGLALRSLLGTLSWKEGREESLPRDLVLALAIEAHARVDLHAALATELDADGVERWSIAAEARLWPDHIVARAGTTARRSGETFDADPLAGVRLEVEPLAVDYAFRAEGETPGATHRFTLAIAF